MNEPALSERAQHLLKVLVERYITDGQPVGSRMLARDSGLDLSSATIRNTMADLEELGLVTSPHTSAGRVPTVHGYRVFIDSLLTIQKLRSSTIRRLQIQLTPEVDPQNLLNTASKLISRITKMAGIVTLPRHDRVVFRHVEFLPLEDRRVLVVLVMGEHEVQNKIIITPKPYSRSELQQAANFLNEQFTGKDLEKVRSALIKELRDTKENADQVMATAIEMASKALNPEAKDGDYVLAGETNLMNFSDISDLDKLRQLFEAFGKKRDILSLLDQVLSAKGVQIFIGEESGYQVLNGCSVVTSPYSVDGQPLGVLAVIGPTRMAYDRVIPIVDVTAKLLGAALNH